MSDEISAVLDPGVPGAAVRADGSARSATPASPARWPGLAAIVSLAISGAALALALFGGQAGSIPLAAAGYLTGSVIVPILAVLAARRRAATAATSNASAATAAPTGARTVARAVLMLALAAGAANAFLLATELAK